MERPCLEVGSLVQVAPIILFRNLTKYGVADLVKDEIDNFNVDLRARGELQLTIGGGDWRILGF